MLNLPSIQDAMNLAVGHEKFLLRNTGVTNDPSVDHYVFNPQNVLSNNRHQKSISQMEGQPNGDATTEGQALQILGYIYMYRGTKEQYWLNRAIAMWNAYVDHFYQGQPIPDEPGRWLCNWIINGKEPVLANWPIDFDSPTHSGFLGSEMTWVNGKTLIPYDAPHWGQYLDKATFAFKGALAWNTIVADVMAVNPDGSTNWNQDGEKYDVDWVIDYLGRKVDWDGNVLEEVASEPAGTVQLKDTGVNGVYKLCYANCQPVEFGGYLIGRNEAWHNRPLRVPVTKVGNLGNAADAELWFCDACYQLWDITKEERYYKAWRSVWYMCQDYSNIDRYDKFFRQSKYDQSPWTDGISYDYDYPSDAVPTYGRDANGYITVNLNKAAQHTMEQQSIAYQIDDQAVVTVNVGGLDVAGNPLTLKVNMELAENKTDDTGVSWQINLPDTAADGSVNTYRIPMTSMSLADNPNGDYIVADKRVMSGWGSATHEFSFEENVYDSRSAQISTSTITSDEDGLIIGFWLTNAEKIIPTEIVYRTDDTHDWWVTIEDADGWRWHWTLPPTRIWDHAILAPKDLRLNGYQPNQAGRPLPISANLVAVDQVSIVIDDMLGSTEAKFSWYCVNDIPPTFSGHTAWTKKFSITMQGQDAFTALLGDCDMQNPNYNPLKYTPGVIPFSNNATDGIVEFDGWRGLPYPGYQHPFIYVHENEDERLNNMIDFLYDSQQAYWKKIGELGPGAAAYVWNRWDNIKYGTADTFTFYHWGDGHPWAGYQPRAFSSAARAWQEMVVSGKTVPTKLIMYVENWINWLITYVAKYGMFPTDFPSESPAVPVPNDFTGHMTGLWLSGACFAALSGCPIAKLDWLIEQAMKELNDNYIVVRDNHVMNGSWSPGVRENTDNGMFFGFWSGEILRGLGTYLMYRRGVPGEEWDILERTLNNLTQVGSGGVTRPDIALKDDMNEVVETANNASDQAKSTAELLETRVPVGRTINSLPLNEDIVLTPEVLNTYDRATIDQKITAVANAGYNPVRVNGHLLNQDVILTAGDIGVYSASEVDGKVNLKVDVNRKINGKDLSKDITLSAGDVNAYTQSEVDTKIAHNVPDTRTVNGKPLSQDITIDAADLNLYSKVEVDAKVTGFVSSNRTVNGKPLSQDVALAASDVGAYAKGDVDALIAGTVPTSRTINGKPLTGNIVIDPADFNLYSKSEVDTKLNDYVPQTRRINGKPLTGDISISLDDMGDMSGVVKSSFRINNKPMTGVSLDLTADDVGAISTTYVDNKLQDYLPVDNASGLGDKPYELNSGSFAESVIGSGFYGYAPVTDEDGVTTNVSDRPTGSDTGRVMIMSDTATYDDEGTVITPAKQDMLGFPTDVDGLWYRKSNGSWTKVVDAEALDDYIKTDSSGLVDKPIVMKSGTAIRAEVGTDGPWKDILNVTPSGAMEVGSSAARLFLYSSNDPSVEIGGVDYKVYTENFPPPAAQGVGGLLKITRFTSSQTFTKQPGTKKIIVEAIGGGGGGGNSLGGSGPSAGAGGVSAAYARVLIDMESVNTIALTVGAGGPGGQAGGQTTVGSYVSLAGGVAGSRVIASDSVTPYAETLSIGASAVFFPANPPSTITQLNTSPGEVGDKAVAYMASSSGGKGGPSPFGPGGRPSSGTTAGNASVSPGAGGGGAAAAAGSASQLGGTGGSGLVIIWEYA